MGHRLGRWHLLLIALVAALLIGALAMLGLDRAMRVSALAETRTAATSQAAILAAGLESELNKFSLVPRVLAVDPEVGTLLAGDRSERSVLNRRLAALARQTNAAAIYLMDADGLTLAASNWDRPDSFVGSEYGFRDYFAGALRDGTHTEFALGTVSRRPGLYLAERVGPADRPLGVVAVKVEFDSLERKWRDAEDGVFVTDLDGIVLLASNPDWRFRAAEAETAAGARPARDPARDAMRFGIAQIETLALPWAGPATSRIRMIEKIQPIAPVGWELHLLADPAPRLSTAIANGRLAGVLGLALLGLAGAGGFIWLRQRSERATAQVAAQTAALREQLQQANRLATLGQITAGLGHEIRQPLAAMRVYAESGGRLLAADRKDEAAGNFDKIAGLADKIGRITEESLQFSRRTPSEPKDIPLTEVIEGSLLLLRDQIRQSGITLVLPEHDEAAVMVRAQHVQLEQVLVNLLQNALQACGTGGHITIAVAADRQQVRLSVSDDGPGVATELRDTLFQPFITGRPEGIGLGLAIARDIMGRIGGDLVLEDNETGACFTMMIPAA
ncbi:sensor histidine kinase [Erythrobacter sanguineus]|jgi:two-component system C4-dicarboxylate transport sensor histidine kinase DctB|uniref:histidine kinase n=1 Tax=Erythrobacter sanguineus TaxID=198312 RepID=A0A1M7S218_9SPHN|nr:ATP-binding protein [Erythrobacter sanguineus]SHN52434.1 two-component system, NtrC family, C4-dicarboxylate transport sensor histidine kinase DctB [Erythrobacter sanguineus]